MQYDLAGNGNYFCDIGGLFLLLDQVQDENAGVQERSIGKSYGDGKQYVL